MIMKCRIRCDDTVDCGCDFCVAIRTDERAKIVAWLRETSGNKSLVEHIADAIERGEHLK